MVSSCGPNPVPDSAPNGTKGDAPTGPSDQPVKKEKDVKKQMTGYPPHHQKNKKAPQSAGPLEYCVEERSVAGLERIDRHDVFQYIRRRLQ